MAERRQESHPSDAAVKMTRKKRYQLRIEKVSLKGLMLQIFIFLICKYAMHVMLRV